MNRRRSLCCFVVSLAVSSWAGLPSQAVSRGYGEVTPRPNVRPPLDVPANSVPSLKPATTQVRLSPFNSGKPLNAAFHPPATSLLLRLVVSTAHDNKPLFNEMPAAVDARPLAAHNPIVPTELWGVWSIVRSDAAGSLSTVEFVINERGWAEITRPDASGKYSTTRHRFQLNNEMLTLTRSGRALVIGKLIEATPRQLVVQAKDRTLTFVRRASS